MIPKIIHYCWFSGEEFDEKTKMCISSWKEKLPDYEIRQCNAENFDMNINNFVKEAYSAKKWAFVADFARLYLLYEYGGVYMDGDVEIVKNIDDFLCEPAFIGQERIGWISAGIIAAEPHNDFIKTCLDYYLDKHFINDDGTYNQITNVQIITHNIFETYGFLLEDTKQKLGGLLTVYPVDYFSPKDSVTGEIRVTDNTFAIHHFNNGWKDGKDSVRLRFISALSKLIGPSAAIFAVDCLTSIKNPELLKSKIRAIRVRNAKRKIIKLKKSIINDLYKAL